MKNLILIGLLFASFANFAADKNQAKKANVELLSSWQHNTYFKQEGKTCYFTTENYFFYSDNTCTKVSKSTDCTSTKNSEVTEQTRWIKFENTIVLLNKQGKQINSFSSLNANADYLLKGQKMISQTIDISKQNSSDFFDNQLLATNQ